MVLLETTAVAEAIYPEYLTIVYIVITMDIYMLYHSKVKEGKTESLNELRKGFEEVYKKHNVDVVGFWEVADNPTEAYYLVKYESDSDYKDTVEKLRADARYQELSSKLNEIRLEMESTKLNPMGFGSS